MTSAKERRHINIVAHKLPKRDRYVPPYRHTQRPGGPIKAQTDSEPSLEVVELRSVRRDRKTYQ